MKQSGLPPSRIFLRFVAPVLLGVACAYVATGVVVVCFWGTANAPMSLDASVRRGEPSVVLPIESRNILALRKPAPATGENASAEPADPAAWVVNAVFVGAKRSIAMVLAMGDVNIVNQNESLHGWKLVAVRPDGTRWQRGAEERDVPLAEDSAASVRRARPAGIAVQRLSSTKFSAHVQLDRSAAAQYLGDPVVLLKEALYKPQTEDGKTIGFKITNIKEKSILNDIGVKNDDVLLRMNGEAVQNPTALLTAYAGISESKTVTLDVLRDGKVESILIELK